MPAEDWRLHLLDHWHPQPERLELWVGMEKQGSIANNGDGTWTVQWDDGCEQLLMTEEAWRARSGNRSQS